MQFVLLIYNDPRLLDAVPSADQDAMMRDCLAHADDMRQGGSLLQSQQLAPASTAKTVRIRNGRAMAVDGPFAEAKEVLGGFNLIEARDMDEAVRIAADFPWARTGSVEVRAVQSIDAVRTRVGAPPAAIPLELVAGAGS